MNPIAKYFNEEKPDEEQPVARDYWVVRCYGMSFYVRPPQAMPGARGTRAQARARAALEAHRDGVP